MKNFNGLISYFCEYDFYSNILSAEVKDKEAKDILLENCDFAYISLNMTQKKANRIIRLLKDSLSPDGIKTANRLVMNYLNHEFSLEELFRQLSFRSGKYIDKLKSDINGIETDRAFFVFYPVVLNRRKRTQQPLITFSCQCLEDTIQIHKVFVNKNVLTLLISHQKGIELPDARNQYGRLFDEMAAAADALRPASDFIALYRLICEEFKHIFGMELVECRLNEDWQILEKALVSFKTADAVIDNCFRDEMSTMERFNHQDAILPETVKRYLGLSDRQGRNISETEFNSYHLGSYQANYSVNRKQWMLMQLTDQSRLLCVEGPPGTGKTTLLKEMIANSLVQKAESLLAVWDKPWSEMGTEGKEISCSPLQGKNPYSVVISSTNNKAIDNIGLELLREVSFFHEFASGIEADAEFAGILCARLGNSRNIEEFYTAFFEPFCRFLETKTVTEEEEAEVKKQFMELLAEMDSMNRGISEFLTLREQLKSVAGFSDRKEKLKYLEDKYGSLTENQAALDKKYLDSRRILEEMQTESEKDSEELCRLDNQKMESDKELRELYSDLEGFQDLTGLKKSFSFLLPKLRRLKKKYVSVRQIEDKISHEKKQCENIVLRMEELCRNITQAEERRISLSGEAAEWKKRIAEIGSEIDETVKQKNILKKWSKCILNIEQKLFKSEKNWGEFDAYDFLSLPEIYGLRNRLFLAALPLFECYVVQHKEPILKNLGILLTKQERADGGTYYNWCRALYNGDAPYSESRAALVRMLWETFFLCFPVVTTTLHSFRKSTFPMVPQLFDMLLIDESGQIVPYYALAPLYRAGRAVFVGDVNQIEPIRSVPDGLLETNYKKVLGETCYSRFCLDTASAQSYAAEGSDFRETIGDRAGGVILNEHRRCEPSIMAFSNEYVYHKVLDLKGKDNHDERLFGSNLIAFDIRGYKAAQHYNSAEIWACSEIVRLFVEMYGEEIKKEIGIITPFSKQAEKLRESIPGVETGTVHVFQGAEKKYILFSCVVDSTEESAGLYHFIGGKCNMLNVAFSRAKKQFIFVGNLLAAQSRKNYLNTAIEVIGRCGKIFSFYEMKPQTTQDLLIDEKVVRILSGEQNLKTDDEIGQYLIKMIPHNIIDTPEKHNKILNNILSLAKHSVYIISPWIGRNVVTDGMIDVIRKKIMNGVSVQIIFGYKGSNCSLDDIDDLVKRDVPWNKEGSAEVIRRLLELLGDRLKYSPPSHIKLLMADDKYLFIGSLNWLYNGGKTEQKEISCLITNPDTISYVKERFLA